MSKGAIEDADKCVQGGNRGGLIMSKGYIMTSSNKCVQGANRGNISTEETPPLTLAMHCLCYFSLMFIASYAGCYKNEASLIIISVRSVCKVSQIAARKILVCPAGDHACRIQYSCTSQPRCRLR